MAKIEQIAEVALRGDGVLVRSLVQDFLRENSRMVDVPEPSTDDEKILAAAPPHSWNCLPADRSKRRQSGRKGLGLWPNLFFWLKRRRR